MSRTDDTTRERREQTSSPTRDMRGMIRRMAINLTSNGFWRVVGHLLIDGVLEQYDAEVFSGTGFYGRPKERANAEAIVVFPGGASNPIIIASRDEDARRAIAQLDADSTAMFNTSTIILVKPDGTVEIRAAGGTAVKLPTFADLTNLKGAINGWTPVANDGGAALKTALSALFVSWPVGTTVLKAQ